VPEKYSKRNDFQKIKKMTVILFGLGVFQIKALEALFLPKYDISPKLAKIYPNLPEKKLNENMTSNKRSAPFCKIKAYTAILRKYLHIFNLPKSPQIFPKFSPNQSF